MHDRDASINCNIRFGSAESDSNLAVRKDILEGAFNGSSLSPYSTYSMQGVLRYEYFCPDNTNLLNPSFWIEILIS
jgi:hypothetical protein